MIKQIFEYYYDELLEIFNCLKVGVYITDANGRTILVNDESCKTGGLTREDVMGKPMEELESEGFVKESVSLKTLKSKRPESMIQDLGDGGKVFVTAQPKYEKGKLQYIITTERDITEIYDLKEVLKEREAESNKFRKEIEHLKNRNIETFGSVVASDPDSKATVEQVLRVAKLDTTVLLMGESGTGKEVYANLIYKSSKREGKPFIKVNCAAISENLLESEMFGYSKGAFTGAEQAGKIGFFELAHKGTLFLDEIGDLPVHLQSKLLRALQEKEIIRVGGTKPIPVDIRLIAATNSDLVKAVEQKRFRTDLYYRLAIMPIEIKPLRERKKDITSLALHFTEKYSNQYKIKKELTESAIEILEEYEWPGNVRELQNIIERSIISFDGTQINGFQIEKLLYSKSSQVNVDDIENSGVTINEMIDAYEKEVLNAALKKYKNASEAARKLGVSKSTMSRKLHRHKIM